MTIGSHIHSLPDSRVGDCWLIDVRLGLVVRSVVEQADAGVDQVDAPALGFGLDFG
jgi:hypothetical protein